MLRELTRNEVSIVSGGFDPSELPETVVMGYRSPWVSSISGEDWLRDVVRGGVIGAVIDQIAGTIFEMAFETEEERLEREERENAEKKRLEEMESSIASQFDPSGATRVTVTMRDASTMSGWMKDGIFNGDGNGNGKPDIKFQKDGSGVTMVDYGKGWQSAGNGPIW